MRNWLYAVLFVSWMRLSMMPDEPAIGEAETKSRESAVEIPDDVDSWLNLGAQYGKKISGLMTKADDLAEDVLISFGIHFAYVSADASALPAIANDWLTGFASGWPNVNTGKVRKSEAKAVLEAFLLGEVEHEIITGTEKDGEGKMKPKKESKKVSDWLIEHNTVKGFEGYGGLIKMAKRLRGPASGQGSGGGRERRVNLTDKQTDEFLERMPAANSNQAMRVAEKATAVLASLPPIAMQGAMFREMAMICNTIKVKTKEGDPNAKIVLDAAAQVWDICENVLAKLNAGAAPQAPAPAVSGQGGGSPEATRAVANA